MVLKGHKVDIVTSNPVLAKRDSENSEKLFKKFDITIAHNIKDESMIYISDIKKFKKRVYESDVVYGTTLEFQSDILQDEYRLFDYRNNRNFDIVIIDEIDCMLVDQYQHKTLLCNSMPFMENYSIICQLLWACYKKLKIDDYEVINDNELQDKLKKYLIQNANNIISKYYGNCDLFIPMCENSKKFAFAQLNNWINNLILSLSYKRNVDYVIDRKGKINPVDKKITGVILKNSIYEDGLYQFLQMQNNLPITEISINTNYLSNLGFFQRYIKKD